MARAAAAGSTAFVIGRPTTRKSAPRRIASAGVTTRFWSPTAAPGIRTPGDDVGDQKRVVTPADAIRRGADYLVVGRPITKAADPAAAARAIAASMRDAFPEGKPR